MISRTEKYALRAAIRLASRHHEGPVRAAVLAVEAGIPKNYLSKLLHTLGKHGVVTSERGRHGGFRLAREPDDLLLREILAPFAPDRGRIGCLLRRGDCSDDDPCPAHEHWKGARGVITDFFQNTSLGDVIPDVAQGHETTDGHAPSRTDGLRVRGAVPSDSSLIRGGGG